MDRERLESWTRRGKTAQAPARRARLVLACAEPGATIGGVAATFGGSRPTVAPWRRRFTEHRADGRPDEPRPGAPRAITDARIERAVVTTPEGEPPNATHWSTRPLAEAVGPSQSAVVRIWRAFAPQPHRSETFKLSRDPLFIDEVRDIAGLYPNPPDRALVLCADEKPSIPAREPAAPILPMRPGQVERRTHDYVRHGATDLFAALGIRSGKVIGLTRERHRAREFRDFLGLIERNGPTDLDIHPVPDNASIHKTPPIHGWLAKRPRHHLHFTPTSASWINMVEGWFAPLTRRQFQRGAFRCAADLDAAIRRHIETNNADPRPFVWTKSVDAILDSTRRSCQRTSAALDR